MFGSDFSFDAGTDSCVDLATGTSYAAKGGDADARLTAYFEPETFIYRGSSVQRLARELNLELQYDVSNEEQDGGGLGFKSGFDVDLDSFAYLSRLGVKVSYRNVEGDGSGGSPGGTEDGLLFPGLGVFGTNPGSNPNGYGLGFGAGANAHSYDYRFDYDELAFEMRVGGEIDLGAFELYYGAGARGGKSNIDDRFEVSVPAFPVNALYESSTDVRSFGGFVDADAIFEPALVGLVSSYFVSLRAGFDANHAESRFLFAFDSAAFDDVQEVTVEESYVTPRLAAAIGLNMDLGRLFGGSGGLNASGTLRGFAELSGGAPETRIPGGGELPEIKADPATVLGASYNFSLKF